jgi:hypothetical protein
LREISIYNGYSGSFNCGFNGSVTSSVVQLLPKSWVCALLPERAQQPPYYEVIITKKKRLKKTPELEAPDVIVIYVCGDVIFCTLRFKYDMYSTRAIGVFFSFPKYIKLHNVNNMVTKYHHSNFFCLHITVISTNVLIQ